MNVQEMYSVAEDDPRLRAFVLGIGRHMAADGSHKAHISLRLIVGEGEDADGPYVETLSMDLPVAGAVLPNFLYPEGRFDKVSEDRLLPWMGCKFNYRYEAPR